jgi:hypothetical protein
VYNSPASYGPKICQYDLQNETKIPVFTGGISVIICMNKQRFIVPYISCYVGHSGQKLM